MWDYVAQARQDAFRKEADARRLVRRVHAERPSPPLISWLAVRSQIKRWLQPRPRPTLYPKAQSQEMQPCVDA